MSAAGESAVLAAALRSDLFRLRREDEWRRLEGIVSRLEKGRLRRVADEDLLALPGLYRSAASSLSIARETSLDAATIGYLEALVQRAWFVVYGPRTSLSGWLRSFLGGGWSAAVRAIWPDLLLALFVMVAAAVAGWLLVAQDADWYLRIVPAAFQDERVPGASAATLRAGLFGKSQESGLGIFAAALFSNNARVAIMAFALGFAFGVPSILLLVQNTATLGAMLWLYHGAGLTLEFAGWLSIHGTTELLAILLAGGAGIHIGRSMAFPGALGVLDAARAGGQRAATVMAGVVLMLVVAALLEGFGRQLVEPTAVRLSIGIGMLAFWMVYFLGMRPRVPAPAAQGPAR